MENKSYYSRGVVAFSPHLQNIGFPLTVPLCIAQEKLTGRIVTSTASVTLISKWYE